MAGVTDQSVPLSPVEAAQLLRVTSAMLQSALPLVPVRLLTWHPAPGEWCIKEVLGHLVEAEGRGFAGRIRAILSQEEPTFQTWDPDGVARERRDCDRDLGDLLGEFRAVRGASVALVQGLEPADLERGGHHPKVGYLRVGDLMQEWGYHDQNHLRQMSANIQACAWPHMGNARGFYVG